MHAKYVSMRRGEPYFINAIFSKVFKFQYYSIEYLDAINDVIFICDRHLVPNFWQCQWNLNPSGCSFSCTHMSPPSGPLSNYISCSITLPPHSLELYGLGNLFCRSILHLQYFLAYFPFLNLSFFMGTSSIETQ